MQISPKYMILFLLENVLVSFYNSKISILHVFHSQSAFET